MEARTDLSVVDKARLVWDVTWRGKREPLGDKTAEALGHDLEWAARLRADANSTLPPLTRNRIEQIENTARKLEMLLASNSDACRMIGQFWQTPSILSPLKDIKDVLVVLCEAAGEAKTHRGGAAELRKEFGSSEGTFILIAKIDYKKHTGRKAGVSLEADQRTLGGPFVRFVQEAWRQFCEGPPPSGETIKKALARKPGVRRAEK